MMAPKLHRSSNGRVVHSATCRHKGPNTIPWVWAEGLTRDEVESTKTIGVRFCGHCKPLSLIER